MDIDISKFQQVFFEDSIEKINQVEQLLLQINLNQIDQETIESIFRCAHSIKGSSGMFEFDHITHFTHILENYLEQVQSHEKSLTKESVDVLLQCFDCLYTMINNEQQHKESNISDIKRLEDALSCLSNGTSNEPIINKKSLANSERLSWNIYFKPNLKIFQNGDDPLRILRSLKEIGNLSCEIDISGLQGINKFYPDECYLGWNIILETLMSENEVRQYAFEWVEDESTITFHRLEPHQAHEKVIVDNIEAATTTKHQDLSIRVNIDKVDELINIVGELVITQLMLTQLSNKLDLTQAEDFSKTLSELQNNCRKLQENVMSIRMLPISNIFNRFPRMVHDLSISTGKAVELKMNGENTELDKTILEKIIDPLVHLVRNALDHGLETPSDRKQSGKSEIGTLELNAYHRGSNIIIEIIDDGNGLDLEKIKNKALEKGLIEADQPISNEELNALIFMPGFSTAEKVTDISGRGIGMDVVRRNIESLGGKVSVKSTLGKGTTFTISLPLTLAIAEGQLVRVGDTILIIPLVNMIETIQIKKPLLNKLGNQLEVYNLRGQFIPIIRLYDLFDINVSDYELDNRFLVIIEYEQNAYGILIDELLQLQQVVIKSIESNYAQIEGISGATILGDGTVALILDVVGIVSAAAAHWPKDLNLDETKTVA
jgi:two-component system chemotaxis sensor kinase CheA